MRSASALLACAVLLSCGSPSESLDRVVARIEIDAPAATLAEDDQLALSARALDRNGTTLPNAAVSWSVAPATVATVSAAGVVTAIARRTATVTAASGAISASRQLTVTPAPITAIDLQPRQADGTVGTPLLLTVALTDRRGRAVTDRIPTFTVVPANVAAVSTESVGSAATHRLTAIASGTAVVTARIDGVSASATFDFALRPVASVSVSPSTLNVPLNTSTHQLTAIVKSGAGEILSGHTVEWRSSNPAVATVTATGTIVPVAIGAATITATVDAKSGSANVTVVRNPITTITLLPGAIAIDRGTSRSLQAIVEDSVGNRVAPSVLTWSSTTPTVATVSSAGVVTGLSSGTATVSAMAESQTASVSVVVREPPAVASVMLTPDRFILSAGQSLPLQTSALSAMGETLLGRTTTFSTTTPGLVSVSASGVVTALATGSATVSATIENRTASLALTVLPTQVASPYDIEVRYISSVPPRVRQAVAFAVNRLRHAITGDVSNVQVSLAASQCFAGSPPINEVIDDILVYIEVVPLPSAAGFSNACWIRTQGSLPIVSYVRINANELPRMESQGWLDQLVLHEFGHAIGLIEFLWTSQGLTRGIGTASPEFTGVRAAQAFAAAGGTATGAFLPLENTGAAGTINTHWRHIVLRPELMSSFITVGLPSPLSPVTLGALGDMGYAVNANAWDAFRILSGGSTTAAAFGIQAFTDGVGTPVGSIDSHGRKTFFGK